MEQTALEGKDVVVQAADLVATSIDGETVMMSIANGKYYGLDPIGTRVWELIAVPRKITELTGLLSQEYAVDEGVCQQDVLEFLSYLRGEGLVRLG